MRKKALHTNEETLAEPGQRPTYSHEEALAAATEYFNGDALAASVWLNKYALKDSYGKIYERSPDEMHRRIATEIARVESRYPNPLPGEEIYQLLKGFRYLVPQGSPMAGIGNPFQVVSLSNCFVIGIEGEADSYGAILKIDEEQVQLMKRRGGVGHDLSHLRPQGLPVMNSALTSTGILPFMERFSNSTREVAQDGRRGALMLTLSVQHPDAEAFVNSKLDNTKVTGANISLRLDDDFMRAALGGKTYRQRFPVGSKKPRFEKDIEAAALWKKIVYNAWRSAEPGVLFWDTVLRESVPDCYADLGFRTISTNPCLTGETLVAVADGRGQVSIKQLAEEGADVPVYCLNDAGKLEIQMMRNPRLTGRQQKIFKLTLDDGSTIRATENHRFRLKNGEFQEMKNFKPGSELLSLISGETIWENAFDLSKQPGRQLFKTEAQFFNHRVKSIKFDGYEDVFNGTVDQHHNFFAGGWASKTKDGKEKLVYLNQKNCGEIPLCPYDSCRLLAINLLSYVQQPYSPEAKFDFELFKKHAALAQRVMDDIIDLELEKIEGILTKIEHDPEPENVKTTERQLWLKIREKCQQGRRTGIGITAEGDTLAALGIRYGSPESLDFCENLHRTLTLAAYRGSVELARERGAFPIFDAAREAKNPFIQRLAEADPQLLADMKKHGRRNIALLTIAPTGTTSLMTQTTSGLEPVFRIAYKRRRKVNPNDKNARPTFTDEVGDSWEDYHIFHEPFKNWLKIKGLDPAQTEHLPETELAKIIEKSPWHRATAEDVDWLSKVRLQGRVQKWIDHSISVTVNVPENTGEDLIEKIYRTGWEAGCKGMTVYREGSRSGVLVSDKKPEPKDVFAETAAPKRPKTLDAAVVSFMNSDERWVAVVGLFEGRPYEIFTGRAEDSFSVLTQISEGKVLKIKENGKNRYDFQYTDKGGYKVTIEGLSRSFDKEYWNYAKLISGVLRHGMPLAYVVEMVENLHLGSASLNNWKNGVARALRKFVPDGTKPSHDVCPSCKTDNLVYQEGCLHCKNCGHSECN